MRNSAARVYLGKNFNLYIARRPRRADSCDSTCLAYLWVECRVAGKCLRACVCVCVSVRVPLDKNHKCAPLLMKHRKELIERNGSTRIVRARARAQTHITSHRYSPLVVVVVA